MVLLSGFGRLNFLNTRFESMAEVSQRETERERDRERETERETERERQRQTETE